jgi:hypothetical protein
MSLSPQCKVSLHIFICYFILFVGSTMRSISLLFPTARWLCSWHGFLSCHRQGTRGRWSRGSRRLSSLSWPGGSHPHARGRARAHGRRSRARWCSHLWLAGARAVELACWEGRSHLWPADTHPHACSGGRARSRRSRARARDRPKSTGSRAHARRAQGFSYSPH